MAKPVQNLLRLLCASALIMLLAAALNFIVDPLHIFRPARWFPAVYSQDARLQDAGLIRSQSFDTVLMGTSLAIHFRQSDIDRLLGVRSLKLSMPGSNSREQSFVLAAAAARGARRVIWEVDDWIFCDAPEIDSDVYLPADLYRRNARGLAGYLFSGAMARESAWVLARSIAPVLARLPTEELTKFPLTEIDDINTLPAGTAVSELYNAGKARAAFAHITDPVRSKYLAQDYDYDAMVRNFERDAVGLIENHPGVKFDVYFPPYSILQWVAMRDASPATLKIVYGLTAYIARRLAELPNVRLHDFRALEPITHDLNNYGDVIHHSPIVDLEVLRHLAEGDEIVDRAAPAAALERLKAQVEAYRLDPGER
jgi:hypothetical protein